MKNKITILLLSILAITSMPYIQSADVEEIEQKQLREEDLLYAAVKCDIGLLKERLRQLVNVNAVNENGITALIFAAGSGHTEIVRILK